ncbi:hypothetical protein OZZ08_08420 [Malaciobacter mytili]|uniref:hypothetical protein n=1 Tax=Malaciobacter mytili TaxID=603050 RepID=UPI003BAFF29B
MTQAQISKYLDIPLTTLNDWKKEDSNRNKLYQLLISLDESDIAQELNKKLNHRFFNILNRNVDDNSKSSFDEIRKAFSRKDYHEGTIKEQAMYSKFFKELEVGELEDFVKTFNVSKRDIKSIYISSPFRSLSGVAKKWDKRFRLKHLPLVTEHKKSVPSALQNILNRKKLANV